MLTLLLGPADAGVQFFCGHFSENVVLRLAAQSKSLFRRLATLLKINIVFDAGAGPAFDLKKNKWNDTKANIIEPLKRVVIYILREKSSSFKSS